MPLASAPLPQPVITHSVLVYLRFFRNTKHLFHPFTKITVMRAAYNPSIGHERSVNVGPASVVDIVLDRVIARYATAFDEASGDQQLCSVADAANDASVTTRSEERRVGKEC